MIPRYCAVRAARRWVRLVVVVAVLVLLGGCSSAAPPPRRSATAPPVGSSESGSAADLPFCVDDAGPLRRMRLPDGSELDGLEYGTGRVGVLLSHQSDGDMCQWQDYAQKLAARGYRALAPSYQSDYVTEALTAVTQLRSEGVRQVVLLGASMGGSISLATAVKMTPAPVAVISLSGPRVFQDLDVLGPVRRLRAPVLFAASILDTPFGPDAVRLYHAATRSAARRLVLDRASGLHGVDLLHVPAVLKPMEAFLARYAPPSG